MDAFGNVIFGRALMIAVRKGLFETVADRLLTIEEISHESQLSVSGTELLVDAFVASGYLKRVGGRYTVTAEGKKWLVKSSPSYLGNLVRYFETLYDRWSYMDYSIEHGYPPKPYFQMFSEEDWKIYVYGMWDLARLLIGDVRNKIVLPRNPKRLLDIGGSHALYAIECCQRYPSLNAVVMDFDNALQHTAAIVRDSGLEERVALLGGDFTKIELPLEQDGILMFNIIHGFREEDSRMLVVRSLRALKPGGKLYILDQMKEKSWRSGIAQFVPLMVGLNILNEIGGNTYSFEQVKRWCVDASAVKRFRLRLPGVTLVEVTK
ncbi:MAG: methyltransferase [Ignavibacteria bacterium]|nr:methyltransferase [Ignavibacteria bacterium]